MKYLLVFILAVVTTPLFALSPYIANLNPGQKRQIVDLDRNGCPDAGAYYNGSFRMINAYDNYARYYFEDGSGQVFANVASVDDLDKATRVIQEYKVEYQIDFGNGAYPAKGWEKQTVICKGYGYPHGITVFVFLRVHRTDPRFTGVGLVFGDWQDFILVWSREGNIPKVWGWFK